MSVNRDFSSYLEASPMVYTVDNQLWYIGFINAIGAKDVQDRVSFLQACAEESRCSAHDVDELSTHPADILEFHISSSGGCLRAAELIIFALSSCGKSVHTYIHRSEVYSGVASAASVIVASVSHITYIDSDATFLIHHARGPSGPIEDPEDVHFWLERTDFDYETINELIKTEARLDARTALSLKFVDEVLIVN